MVGSVDEPRAIEASRLYDQDWFAMLKVLRHLKIIVHIYKNVLLDHVTSAEVGGCQGWITGGIGKN